MKGIFTPNNASRSATLVCVNAAGLKMMQATCEPGASWIRLISSASALLWKADRRWPASAASWLDRFTICSSVTDPYVPGSRVPSRFRLGPLRSSRWAMQKWGAPNSLQRRWRRVYPDYRQFGDAFRHDADQIRSDPELGGAIAQHWLALGEIA